ncbi:hypothetical protein E2C01_048792 [Portunus trituberculatus]|uniref:Uncharacterized protein n=1 Tax=Portunus trituberculatus TaxID=210409 RepID=A0A5B7G7C9_PORTR|nr:hypothetical protein [Portunus trituberculatus]
MMCGRGAKASEEMCKCVIYGIRLITEVMMGLHGMIKDERTGRAKGQSWVMSEAVRVCRVMICPQVKLGMKRELQCSQPGRPGSSRRCAATEPTHAQGLRAAPATQSPPTQPPHLPYTLPPLLDFLAYRHS